MRRIQTIAGWLVMAAALTIGMTACSNDDNTANEPGIMVGKTQSYTLRVEATKGNVTTRAIDFDEATGVLDATWEAGDLVYVYSVTGEAPNETLSRNPVATLVATEDGKTTTLLGKFTNSYTPTAGTRLRLKFLAPDYASQDGTLDYIADHCDYATADVTIAEVDGKQVKTTAATFQNHQAIVRFSLKDTDMDAAIAATSLSIEYGSATYTVTPDAAASELYVAIPGQTDAQIKLYATVGTDNYSYKESGVTFENGSYYAVAVKMKKEIWSMALSAVTWSHIGWRIGSDGRAYEPSGEMPEGVTAVAMICYVENDHHGRAIELSNSSELLDGEEYVSEAYEKAAVPGLSTHRAWSAITEAEWYNLITGCNGKESCWEIEEVSAADCQAFINKYNATGYTFREGTYWTNAADYDGGFGVVISTNGIKYTYIRGNAYGLAILDF